MKEYSYSGRVQNVYGICIDNLWTASTTASSERKAMSNLQYRYKKEHGLTANAKITLPDKIFEVTEEIPYGLQ